MFDLGLIPPSKWDRSDFSTWLDHTMWTVDEDSSTTRISIYRCGAYGTLSIDSTGIGVLELGGNRKPEDVIGHLLGFASRRWRRPQRILPVGDYRLDMAIVEGGGRRLKRVERMTSEAEAEGLFELLRSETESLMSDILAGIYVYQSHRHVLLQRARVRAVKTSPLMRRVPDGRWRELFDMLDAADAQLDADMEREDRLSKGAENLLIFIVSVSTVIPVLWDGRAWMSSRGFWTMSLILFLIYLHSWRRK